MTQNTETQAFTQRLTQNVRRVILGGDQAIELAMIALLCKGHMLLEDFPGLGKTMLARSIARSLGCSFSRIQFTPDILPADINGVLRLNQKTGAFEYRPGPIMAQIVLIDEINRASSMAQAALLEAMQEGQVTVEKNRYPLPVPFIVMATMNRIERHGISPLPTTQLDRFFMRIGLGYPSQEHEIAMLAVQKFRHPFENLKQSVTTDELIMAQEQIKQIHVSPLVQQYIIDLIEATRWHVDIRIGGSPRCSLALFRGSQARAAIYGRDFVLPDDIKALFLPILGHRVLLSPRAHLHKHRVQDILEEILGKIPVPSQIQLRQREISHGT